MVSGVKVAEMLKAPGKRKGVHRRRDGVFPHQVVALLEEGFVGREKVKTAEQALEHES